MWTFIGIIIFLLAIFVWHEIALIFLIGYICACVGRFIHSLVKEGIVLAFPDLIWNGIMAVAGIAVLIWAMI